MRKFRDFFKFKEKEEEKRAISVVAPSLSGRPQYLPFDFQTFITEGFKGNDLVYACMKEKADSVKEPPLKIYKNGKEIEHPLRKLLSRPNPFTTEEQLLEKIQYHLDSAGNAYVLKVRANLGLPIELWNKNPDKVRPIPDEWKFIKGWEIKVGNSWHLVSPEDIIWLKYSDPENDFFGFPPLAAAALRIGVDNELSKYIKHILANMAVTTGIFKTEGTSSDEVYERNRRELMELYSGMVNAGRPFLVEGGVEYQKIGLGLNELDFGNLWAEVSARIMSAFQVPPILIGSKLGLERSTFANYKEAKKSFYDETIVPLWSMYAGAFEHSLFPDFKLGDDYNLKFDLKDITALAEEVDKRYERQERAKDILTINQRLALIGEEPIEGGDVIYLPINLMPMLSKKPGKKEFKTKKKEIDIVQILKRLQDAYYPLYFRGAKEIFELYEREYSKVLDALNIKAKRAEALYEKIKIANGELNDEIAAKIAALSSTVIEASGETVGEAIGIAFDMVNPLTQEFLKQYPFKFAKDLGETNVDKIRDVIAKADVEGWGVPEISKALRGEFKDWTKVRAEIVARTEIIRATNSAARASYWQAGAKELVWITFFDERTCDFCADLDGKVVGIEENFFNQGDEFTIEKEGKTQIMKLDYEDVGNPPLHVRCRCSIGGRF